jgi:hypothetical protein
MKALPPNTIQDLTHLKIYCANVLKSANQKRSRIAISQDDVGIIHEREKTLAPYFARKLRALCLHYRFYSALPVETRGGKRETSFLDDEEVFTACRQWLTQQAVGTVHQSSSDTQLILTSFRKNV